MYLEDKDICHVINVSVTLPTWSTNNWIRQKQYCRYCKPQYNHHSQQYTKTYKQT